MIRKPGDISDEVKGIRQLLSRSGFVRLVNALKARDKMPKRQGPKRERGVRPRW